jgi:ligand-binding sensor domain-containing protein
VFAVQATSDGSVWIGTPQGLNRWKDGEVTAYRALSTLSRTVVAKDGLRGGVQSLGLDDRERLWASTPDGVAYLEGGEFKRVPDVPAGAGVYSMAGDAHGKVWILHGTSGLLRVTPERTIQAIAGTQSTAKLGARRLLSDPLNGGVWLAFLDRGIAYFEDGKLRASYTVADGLGGDRVDDLHLGADSAVWVATEGGLSRVKGGRITTLTSRNGLPCDAVQWSIEDDGHSFWLYMPCGLVRIPRSEMDRWVKDPGRSVKSTVLDATTGCGAATISASMDRA